ncbi:uncharacterized protein [Anabrus simplex]|uniref:uncharacterized protein isoform X2 n=1 Tax=Anabrus simplex TaxID=316456 RepID=UPI0035A3D110
MEVVPVPVSGGGAVQLPFQRRNVQEWSRLDRLTGMLEHARVETDQWAANTATSTRKYGKVVDSRARNLADGSVQQRQRKQLEVFQAQVPGGSFQVIRTQSVTSTSSSSNSVNWRGGAAAPGHNFDNLQLSGHPLDLAPQKNKANVGRSGSIRTRRPPSRPRSIISKLDSSISEEEKLPVDLDNENTQNVHSRLSQVSRICHQIHKATTKKAFDNSSSRFETPQRPFDEDLEIEVPTTRLHHFNDSSTDEDDENGVHIEEILDDHHSTSSLEKTSQKRSIALNGSIHKSVSRKKSSSTEDLQSISLDNRDKSGKNSRQELDWKRTSQIRRSLQFPLKVTQENIPQQRSSPVKLLQESNEGRTREVSALKGYEALESIFRRGANIAESVNKSMTYDRDDIDNIATDSLANHLRNENMSRQLSSKFGGEGLSRRESSNVSAPSSKRHSFVTVESLKEVRGRLRRLSSPPLDDVPMKNNLKGIVKDADEHDDGIVTEEFVKHSGSNESMEVSVPSSRVRSYVFGMEANTSNNSSNGRKPLPGTGSLESRTSSKSSGNGGSRSEEWYNRRKSYGFEPVHSHDSDEHSKSIKFREKNKVESSTDSGICQSSEAVTSSVWSKTSPSKNEENDYFQKQIMSDHAHNSENVLKISHNIQIKKTQGDNLEERQKILDSNEDRNDDTSLQKGRRTVVTLGKESNSHKSGFKTCDDGTIIVHNSIMKDDSLALKTFASGTGDSKLTQLISSPSNHRDKNVRSLSESVTITIPVVSEDKGDSSNVESKRLFFRQLSEGTSVSIESPQNKSVLLNGVLHKENSSPVSLLRSNSQAAFKRGTWNNEDNWPSSSKSIDSEMKRHSIAVAEPEYVREELKSSSARNENHKNQFEKEFANVSTSELVKRFAAMHSLKQEVSSHQPNKENGATIGINVSFIQNGEVLLNHDENSDDLLQQNGKKQKKVEFCKTEVHFAAESGRFNIVETDEKPPPSNMFRRRRRNSSANIISNPAVDSNKNTLPEVRFGDSPYEKKLLGGNENSDSVKTVSLESLNKNAPAVITKPEMTHSMILAMSKFQDDADKEDQTYTLSNATIVAAPHVETSPAKSFEDNLQYSGECKAEQLNNVPQAQNEPLPRSILKNNRKPRPFLLGENNNMSVDPGDKPTEEQDEKWGIRLRPVQSRGEQSTGPMWRSTVTLQNTIFDSSKSKQVTDKEESELSHCSNESELQKLVRSLRPTSQRNVGIEVATSGSSKSPKCSPVLSKKTNTENCMNGVQVKILATSPETRQTSLWSVADRIKQVEELKQSTPETKGYSTRINFGGGEATIIESVSSDDQQESSHKQPGQTASPVSHSSFQHRDRPKPIWLRREERKQTSVMAHDAKKQTTSKKGLMVRIGNSDPSSSEVHASLTCYPDTENLSVVDNGKTKKTTMITIDLTSSPHCDNNKVQLMSDTKKIKPENIAKSEEVLLSPSLIMKTILNPSALSYQSVSFDKITSLGKSAVCNEGSNSALSDLNSSARSQQEIKLPDKKVKSESNRGFPEKGNDGDECGKMRSVPKLVLNTSDREPFTIPSQLAALKEMYYSGDLSDDSERADEEVRSYMSGGGDEDDIDIKDEDASSVVSGSWSRMRAYRNIRHHFHKFNTGNEPQIRGMKTRSSLTSINDLKKFQDKFKKGHPKLEANTDEPHQLSIASTVLPSYDQNRLRSVETLISTRSGQPKITSISLRYEGDQDVDSKFGDPLIKDSRKFRENGERQECYSFTDFKEEGRNLQSQRTENIDHITTSLTYASPIQISPSQGRISPSKEKSHSQSYVKDNYHKSKEKLSHLSSTSTYQKNKESSSGKQDRLCKGNSVLVKARVEENELHEKDSKNVHKNKENHHIGEKSYMNTIDRTTHVRETRSKSPADNDMLPSERRRNSSPSKVPSSQAATSVHYHDSNKERTPSPVTKSHHKAGSRVYGLSSEKSCSRNFKRMQNQDDHVSSEFSKETLGSKLMKGTNDATNRFSAQNIKDDQESTISDSEEVLTNSPLMIKSSSHQAENVSQKYDKEAKASRSRFVSRGRSVSPNKNPKISSSIKSRNLADHKVSRDSSESPIYENRSMFPEDADNKLSRQCRKDVTETDCTILEELTRAADQILQAVNGYTDDESTRASSEDDEQSGRYRRGRRSIQIKRSSASLGTISETPVHKQKEMPGSGKQPTDIQKTSSTVRRTQRLSKTRTGQNSSTSSVESFTKELRRSSTSLLKKEQSRGVEDRGKRRLTNSSTNAAMKAGSRTARLLQRASSREMLLQTHASSSEDIMSGAEVENNRKPRVPRRNRTGNININKTPSLASVTSSTKKTSSPSSSGQNISSPAATRLQRKDVNEVPRERHSTSATPRQRRSTGDQAKSHSNRARETRRSLLDEESHRRNSRREGTERKQCSGREGMEKMAGSSFTQQTPSRDKLDVNTSERRSVGNSAAVVKSSASHVVYVPAKPQCPCICS